MLELAGGAQIPVSRGRLARIEQLPPR